MGDFANFDAALTADYTVTDPANGCTAISTDLAGKIALIDRGVCTFTTKIRNAETAGAAGVLILNNVAGDPVGMAHDGTDPFPTIPAAMLGKADGAALKPSGTATVDGTPRPNSSATMRTSSPASPAGDRRRSRRASSRTSRRPA